MFQTKLLHYFFMSNNKSNLYSCRHSAECWPNDGPKAVLQSPLSTLVSASARDSSALDCTKTTNFPKNIDVNLLYTQRLTSTSRTTCTGISKYSRTGNLLSVNILGYTQTKLLDSTRIYSLFYPNWKAQEVESEINNVDLNRWRWVRHNSG